MQPHSREMWQHEQFRLVQRWHLLKYRNSVPPPPGFSRRSRKPKWPLSPPHRRSRESWGNQEGTGGDARAHARTHVSPRPADGRLAPGLAPRRAAPEARTLSGFGCGGGGCRGGPCAARASSQPSPRRPPRHSSFSLTSVSAPRSERRNGARLAKPERTPTASDTALRPSAAAGLARC